MYMTLEGIYGTALSVSSTLIILFTIYGAFLQFSGAGKFYIDFSFAAMGGKPTSAGRTVTLASFLLGGPSGSGVATTVTLGAVAAPMLAKVGYSKDEAGGLLAAGGLGAIISPPVLGAAAFIIAEFLKISYLDVVLMATIPTCLYYLALFIMVEIDVRKFGMKDVLFEQIESAWSLTKKYWFHFLSLVSIVVFMLLGFSPELSVFWATVVAFVTSFLHKGLRTDLLRRAARTRAATERPGRFRIRQGAGRRLARGAQRRGDLRRRRPDRRRRDADRPGAEIQLDRARLCRQLLAAHRDLHRAHRLDRRPRRAGDRELHHLRRDRRAGDDRAQGSRIRGAHVHLLLRGAVGSLAADRALAVRRRRDHRRRSVQDHAAMLEVHGPAFLVPFMFVLDPSGQGLLLTGSFKTLGEADWGSVALVTFTAAIGIAALAGGLQGWLFKRTTRIERLMLVGRRLSAGVSEGDVRRDRLYARSDRAGHAMAAKTLDTDILILGAGGAGLFRLRCTRSVRRPSFRSPSQ
jgi:hypothetical protein